MNDRIQVSSGALWEARVGYARAVRVGAHIAVSGTCAVGPDGQVVGLGDPAAQTRRCIEIIRTAIKEAGGRLEDVVRTRIYVTDIANWPAVGQAHAQAFGDIRPASTMVQVSALVDAELLVEIEADAIVAGP